MRYIVAAAMLLASNPALAQLQVPGECAELAAREGFPADVLTRTQAASARVRLARLSDSDPLVKQCRGAIRRAQVMMKDPQKPSSSVSSEPPAP